MLLRRFIPAGSCDASSTVLICGSFSASAWLYFAGSLSISSPVFKSTSRAVIRSANTSATSSFVMPSCISPATARMLRCLSSVRCSCCSGFSPTADPATTMEQTRHSTSTTSSVLLMLSLFLTSATRLPPLNVGAHDQIVEQRRKQVGKQNGQHHPFRIGRVDHANQYTHHPNERAVTPFTSVGKRG